MHTTFRNTALLLCALLFTFSAQAAELTVNKIAAVVNGEMITMLELQRHTMTEAVRRKLKPSDPKVKALEREALDSMINDILLRQEAKRYKVTVSDAEVEAELQRNIARIGVSSAKFDEELKRQGTTRELYKERISNMMLRQRMTNYMVSRKVFVTSEDVENYYNQNKSKMLSEKMASFSILLLPEKAPVKQIYEQVRSGKLKFEDAARKHSADASAKDGGTIKDVPWDKMPPDMHKLLSSLKDGQMSPPLRTQGGFVVIRRDGITEPKSLNLLEATPKIEEILRAPLLEERFKEYTTQLRGKAVIDIRI